MAPTYRASVIVKLAERVLQIAESGLKVAQAQLDETDAMIRSGMDKTAYPRAALLEALVRYVTADLEAQ